MNLELSQDFVKKYFKRGPRYTSYPTAVVWNESFQADDYCLALKESDKNSSPLSLYIHIPFCHSMCYYCGCNTTITKNQDKASKYLEHLKEEIRLVCSYLPHRRQIGQLHFGGGTPTFLNNEQFSDIMNGIRSYFQLTEDAEVSVEIDPRVTSREQVYHLKTLGFNRISMGVQDFTKEVQEAIHRIQSRECVEELTLAAKECGFQSINFDLIYGLPHQTIENFHETAKAVCELRPDRIALFGYAHVPWKKTHQKKIDSSALPSPVERLGLLLHTSNLLQNEGYKSIGMDHFALEDDELYQASLNRTLHRNFQGYTIKSFETLGFGVSSISFMNNSFSQNERNLSPYYSKIESGNIPVIVGHTLNQDDIIRQHVIEQLMCNFYLSYKNFEEKFQMPFFEYFPSILDSLHAFQNEGLLILNDDGISITQNGRMLVRNVCMHFDAYMTSEQSEESSHRFSQTV